jgi:hypothetical protein
MALVNWEYLDKEYETLLNALVKEKPKSEKNVSIGKVIAQTKVTPEPITPAQEWDAYMLKNKGQMPPLMRELLESLTSTNAGKQVALMRFGMVLVGYWSDARAEVKQLTAQNAVMVAERQKYKDFEIQAMLKS